ncbi:MAG: hypothetical protein ACI4GA_00285 [Acutalibacteraceae bacterium]
MAFSSVDSLRLRLKAQPFELGAYLKTPQSWRAGGKSFFAGEEGRSCAAPFPFRKPFASAVSRSAQHRLSRNNGK